MKPIFSFLLFLLTINCFAQKHFGGYNTFESKAFGIKYDAKNHVKKMYLYFLDNEKKKVIIGIDSIDSNGFVCKGWSYKYGTDTITEKFEVNRDENNVKSIKVEITPQSKEYYLFYNATDNHGNWIKKRFPRFKHSQSLKFLMKFNFRDTCHYSTDYYYLDGKFADRIYDLDTIYCGKSFPIDWTTKRYLSNFNKDSIVEYDFQKSDCITIYRYSPDSTLAESTMTWKPNAKVVSNRNRIESQFYFYNLKKKVVEQIYVSNNKIYSRNLFTYFNDSILKSFTICNTTNSDSCCEKYYSQTIWNKAGKQIFYKRNFFNEYPYLSEKYKWDYDISGCLLNKSEYIADYHDFRVNQLISIGIYEYEFYDDSKK